MYAAETSVATAQGLAGNDLSNATTQVALGFSATDLEGIYFTARDYTIAVVDGTGIATIASTSCSKANLPIGTYMLRLNGSWGGGKI